jgi:hypothetical protein
MSFHEGGWGMFPTSVLGVLLLVGCAAYVLRPGTRTMALIIWLGLATVSSGVLGTTVGFINTLREASRSLDPLRFAVTGCGESLNVLALSIVFATMAMLLAAARVLRTR